MNRRQNSCACTCCACRRGPIPLPPLRQHLAVWAALAAIWAIVAAFMCLGD